MKKKYLVLIPARGGSKGVLHKNIVPVGGFPMISYTIELLRSLDLEFDVAISTDDELIMEISREYVDGDSRFYIVRRPDEYAKDTSSTEDVALHIVNYMEEKYDFEYENLVTMAPNLPLRTKEMFINCLDSFEKMDSRFDSQVCFCKTTDDLWRESENGEYIRVNPDAPRRRQDREPLFIEKGSITITKIKRLFETKSLWGNCVHGFLIDEKASVDVHDEFDIKFLEFLLENR